jgi:hypothetical protein
MDEAKILQQRQIFFLPRKGWVVKTAPEKEKV